MKRRRTKQTRPRTLDRDDLAQVAGGNRTDGDHDIIIDPDDDLMPPARPA